MVAYENERTRERKWKQGDIREWETAKKGKIRERRRRRTEKKGDYENETTSERNGRLEIEENGGVQKKREEWKTQRKGRKEREDRGQMKYIKQRETTRE